jgi:hypothetical protein
MFARVGRVSHKGWAAIGKIDRLGPTTVTVLVITCRAW